MYSRTEIYIVLSWFDSREEGELLDRQDPKALEDFQVHRVYQEVMETMVTQAKKDLLALGVVQVYLVCQDQKDHQVP